jgi:hypothetical protein
MDVAADLQQIFVLVDDHGLVTLLEYMAGSSMAPVKIERVAGLESLHHLGKISFRRLYQQMEVVGQ